MLLPNHVYFLFAGFVSLMIFVLVRNGGFNQRPRAFDNDFAGGQYGCGGQIDGTDHHAALQTQADQQAGGQLMQFVRIHFFGMFNQ